MYYQKHPDEYKRGRNHPLSFNINIYEFLSRCLSCEYDIVLYKYCLGDWEKL